MAETLEKHIGRYFKESERLSKQDLVGSIKKDFPTWSDNTINMYLQTPTKLTTLGRFKLTTPGRSKLTMLGRAKLTT